MMVSMTDAGPAPRGPADDLLVGPAAGSRCDHRLARDSGLRRRLGPRWWEALPADEGRLQRSAATSRRRRQVRDLLAPRVGPGFVDVVGEDWPDPPAHTPDPGRTAATLRAMAGGAAMIWGAELPADPATGREPITCTLVRAGSTDDGGHGFVPVLVVNHKVLDPRRGRDAGPADVTELPGWTPHPDHGRRLRRHPEDVDKLCHAWRLLEALGRAPAPPAGPGPVGGVLGLGADGAAVVHPLARRLPASDTEIARRRAVASGHVATSPSRIGECRHCPWWEGFTAGGPGAEPVVETGCRTELERADDVSLVVTGSQATALRAAGVTTVTALAECGARRPAGWQGEPFTDAVLRARALRSGRALLPRVTRPAIRRADVEVDVDLESHFEDGAYLWGTLLTVRDGREAPASTGYRAFVTWEPLPAVAEGRVVSDFWAWLGEVRERTESQGRSFAAYCYSRAAEDGWMRESARRYGPEGTVAEVPGVPSVRRVRGFVDSPAWVDVHEAVARQFVSTVGTGLKAVAPEAGFHWRDPEAGGEASLGWYRRGRGLPGGVPDAEMRAARRRILRYNEDDVRATLAVREWISAAGRG